MTARRAWLGLFLLACQSPFHHIDDEQSTGGTGDGGVMDAGSVADAFMPDAPPVIDGCTLTFTPLVTGLPASFSPAWIEANGTFDTESNVRCSASSTYCVVTVESFNLPVGNTLRLTGDEPFVLVTTGDIVIDGTLDLSGDDGGPAALAGPAGGSAFCSANNGGQVGTSLFYHYGGGGNVDPGGDAHLGSGGGATSGIGCPGGDGYGFSYKGKGGGLIWLISLCGSVQVNGTIDARGGGGSSAGGGGGGGGGAAGTVVVQTRTPMFAGPAQIRLAGGAGGGGGCYVGSTTAGMSAVGTTPGTGATCTMGWIGGTGGAAGVGTSPPGQGMSPTTGTGGGSNKAYGGGGGGSRGRLHLVTPADPCPALTAATQHDGECSYLVLE